MAALTLRLNIRRLTSQFKLRQIVDTPTRRDWTLDLVLTNLPQLYDKNSVQMLSPSVLSDHNVVNLNHKTRATRGRPSRKQISRSHTLASKKLELGGYLCTIDWSLVDLANNCEDKLQLPTDFILTGLDFIMPIK